MKKLFILICLLLIPSAVVQAYEEHIAGFSVTTSNSLQAQAEIERDIPLPFIYQAHTYAQCLKYEVDYDLALAVMNCESEGQIEALNINDNGTVDKGLMQINSFNYDWLREELGVTDFYDPFQNIECGVFMLGELSGKYSDYHQILMSYNMGERRMRKLRRKGIYSSKYSRRIVNKIKSLKEGGTT